MSDLVHFMIDAGIASRREVSGCTDNDIAAVEHEYSYLLPEAFKTCLHVVGRECGKLSDCDRFGVDVFAEAKEVATAITTEEDASWQLPEYAVPFLQHQGYNFLYLRTDCGDDPPVWYYVETHPEPGQAASSFTGWLRDTALLCVEHKPWND